MITTTVMLQKQFLLRTILLMVLGAAIGVLAILFVPLNIDIQMQTTENGHLQYFYEVGTGFSEENSKLIELSPGPNFVHYNSFISALGLRAIRIDPIESQGKFEIAKLSIHYLFWSKQWAGRSELSKLLTTRNIDLESSDMTTYSGQSVSNDPNLIISATPFLQYWQTLAIIYAATLGAALVFLLRYLASRNILLPTKYILLFTIVSVGAWLRVSFWYHSGLASEVSKINPGFDEKTYFLIAQFIMEHGIFEYFRSEQSVLTAPMNPIFIALIFTIFKTVNAVRAANLLMSILSILIIYKIGKKLFDIPVGLLAAALFSVQAQLIEVSAMFQTETLFLFLFLTSIYYLITTVHAAKLMSICYFRNAMMTGLFLALAILTRSIIMLLPVYLIFVIGVWEVYKNTGKRNASFPLLKRTIAPMLIPLLVVGSIAVKNSFLFDRFIVATGSGAALWLGSRADTEGDEPPYRGLKYDTLNITNGASHLSLNGDRLLTEAGKKNIKENPFGYAWWNVKKVGRLMVGNNLVWFLPHRTFYNWYLKTNQDLIGTLNKLFQIVLSSAIAVLGVLGLFAYRNHKFIGLLLGSTASYLIFFSLPFFVIQRYGLPLVVLSLVPAAALIIGAWKKKGVERTRVLYAMPVVLAIVLQILTSS